MAKAGGEIDIYILEYMVMLNRELFMHFKKQQFGDAQLQVLNEQRKPVSHHINSASRRELTNSRREKSIKE